MSRAKPGEYCLELDLGKFDLVSLRDDTTESQVLDELKAELIREGKFPEQRSSKICWASLAALIMYIESIAYINDCHRDETEPLH